MMAAEIDLNEEEEAALDRAEKKREEALKVKPDEAEGLLPEELPRE